VAKDIKLRVAVILTLVISLVGVAVSAAPPPPALSAGDEALVQRAVAYLEGLSSDTGRFEQTDARGRMIGGAFYLQRPGKARFDYDPPSGLMVASDGKEVSEIDRRLKTAHSVPLASLPISMFLARDIRLDRGVRVVRVTHDASTFTLVARDIHHPGQGEMALTFTTTPLALTGWTVNQGRNTSFTVRLIDFHPSAPRDESFFEIRNQRPGPAGGA